MDRPRQVVPDVEVLSSYFPIPSFGFLPINAFVIKAREPVLVDTGIEIETEEFMNALESILDPRDLRWVWRTHDDADHTGSIQKVLEAAPSARLVTHSLACLRMSTAWPVPMDRVHWLNSGDRIEVGDRELTAVRPPLFDNPTTIGLYDSKSEAFFSADCFGAIMASPAQDLDEVAESDLSQGMAAWASADSPWVHMVEARAFKETLNGIRRMAPKTIFSAHLPPAQGKTEQVLQVLGEVPTLPSFVAPDQTALEHILAQARSGIS
jgi:flavorubredoxin